MVAGGDNWVVNARCNRDLCAQCTESRTTSHPGSCRALHTCDEGTKKDPFDCMHPDVRGQHMSKAMVTAHTSVSCRADEASQHKTLSSVLCHHCRSAMPHATCEALLAQQRFAVVLATVAVAPTVEQQYTCCVMNKIAVAVA